MDGAKGTTSVAAVLHQPRGYSSSMPSSGRPRPERESHNTGVDGPLAAAKKMLAQSLSRSGFIDPTASLQENFAMYLRYHVAEAESGDLKPGALRNLVFWLMSQVAADAERSAQAQAHVSPEAAVTVLT